MESKCDIIIVGRGIYEDFSNLEKTVETARLYQKAGWDAYLERIK
jgi:orotidine-5'-phosphate decarboxylase